MFTNFLQFTPYNGTAGNGSYGNEPYLTAGEIEYLERARI